MITKPSAGIVGVDVGGTFTDFVFVTPEGRLAVRKLPSAPAAPGESVVRGVRDARASGLLHAGFRLSHGTTVATNALLERRGARTALVMTRGFEDVLEIGRQTRSSLYSLSPGRPEPLIRAGARCGLRERVDWQGTVLTPLDSDETVLLLDRLRAEGIESIAVCLLFSFLNPDHERQVGDLARARGFSVSLSSRIAPEPREYERASTTAANAFVAPIVARYLTDLAERMRQEGAGPLQIMQSHGGVISPEEAAERAIVTGLSGPAAGVIAATEIGAQVGIKRLLTCDMGGTSTDVALILDGQCPVVTTGSLAGLPLQMPILDIHTVGAGGGSLVWTDAAGALRVGPRSAGADPGPVAYGKGTDLTVTDAHVLLGRIPATVRLAGELPLDFERVRGQFSLLARRLVCTPDEAALGVLRIVETAMTRALRHISVERGHDLTDFTLLSFGGAGGLHACALAESLGLRDVLIPRFPGAFSALGLTLADVVREYTRALPIGSQSGGLSPEEWETLRARWVALEQVAAEEMAQEGFPPGEWSARRFVEMRYVGQSFALRVPVARDASLDASLVETRDAFHRAHRARFGHADPLEPVEAVAVRVSAVGHMVRPDLRPVLPAAWGTPFSVATLRFPDESAQVPLYERASLAAEQRIPGPALILQDDATTCLLPGWHAVTDCWGNLRLGTGVV